MQDIGYDAQWLTRQDVSTCAPGVDLDAVPTDGAIFIEHQGRLVDNSDAPGHKKGRVYVVWDRVAPVVYDYCDANCDDKANWLPNLQTVSGLVFPGQGIGAYPMVMPNGGLGIVIQTTNAGLPTSLQTDNPEVAGNEQVFISAPAAGTTPYPGPLVFIPPIQISKNGSNGVRAQRASDSQFPRALRH